MVLAALLLLSTLAVAALVALNLRDEGPIGPAPPPAAGMLPAQQVERGRYLARAGNCAGCHSQRGDEAYAGGVAFDTPFGTLYSSNLTPDRTNGIGDWNADAFWRAMHNGRSRDGRLLYPAFPYPSFTILTRDDSDALYAFLRTLPPSVRANTPHALRFPYDTQAALAVWRALYFRPARFEPDAARPAEWKRGAYLVEGLGHCIACHGARNTLGAVIEARGLTGGVIPNENWYAPSLASPHEAGVAGWSRQAVVQLLKTGRNEQASVSGPMADVVWGSTQYLVDDDLVAIASYLQQLPAGSGAQHPGRATTDAAARPAVRRDPGQMQRGERTYDQRCAYCHGDRGQGGAGAYPPLAGNRAVLMDSSLNLVQMVRRGGFLPQTAGNPRPYGMPPFDQTLDDQAVADVLTFIRGSWGNDAAPVSAGDLLRR